MKRFLLFSVAALFAFNANAGGARDIELFKASNSTVGNVQINQESDCVTFNVDYSGDPWSATFNPPTWFQPSKGKSEIFEISFDAKYEGNGIDGDGKGHITLQQGRHFTYYNGDVTTMCTNLGIEEVDAYWKIQNTIDQLIIEDFTGAPNDFQGGRLTRNVNFYPTDGWQHFTITGTLGRHASDSVDLEIDFGKVAGTYFISHFQFSVKNTPFAQYFMAFTHEPSDGYFIYDLHNDGTASIVGNDLLYNDKSVTIPQKITYKGKDYKITAIKKNAFYGCSQINSLTIPYTITSVENGAFNGCNNIKTLSYNTNAIGNSFYNKTSLKTVIIGDSVTYINNSAFSGCYNLESVTIGNSVTSIGSQAFAECSSLTSIIIPESVSSIGDYAFYNCSALTYNEYDNAYYLGSAKNPYLCLIKAKSTEITSCAIDENCKFIYDFAFEGCSSLATLNVPEAIISIGTNAFFGCTNLTSISIGNSVKTIGYGAFCNCKELTSVVIPNSVTNIDHDAFISCSKLTAINVESDNTKYTSENGIVFNKDKTTILWYPAGKTETTYSIPNSVTSIGYHAFYDCSGLTMVTIPESVTSIGNEAFSYCSGLTTLTIPNSVINIYGKTFNGCSGLVYNEYDNAYYLGNAENPYLCLIKAKSSEITSCTINEKCKFVCGGAFVNCSSLSSVTIPNSVTTIGECAFEHCTNLKSVVIPDSVTTIGELAFADCTSLKSVTIPNSVTTIDYGTFAGCTSLTSVIISNFVTTIRYLAFYECTNLTSITIPNSVTSIGEYAFYECTGLTSVTIPNSVTTIGEYAFDECKNATLYCQFDKNNLPNGLSKYINQVKSCMVVSAKADNGNITMEGSNYTIKGGNDNTLWYLAETTNGTVTLTVSADSCYHFVKWSDDKVENPRTEIVTESITYTAIFEPHTIVIDSTVDATCTESGLTEGKHCSACKEVLVAQETIPALGHTIVVDEAVAATTTSTGLTEGSHCSVCGYVSVPQFITQKINHPDTICIISKVDTIVQIDTIYSVISKTDTIYISQIDTICSIINKIDTVYSVINNYDTVFVSRTDTVYSVVNNVDTVYTIVNTRDTVFISKIDIDNYLSKIDTIYNIIATYDAVYFGGQNVKMYNLMVMTANSKMGMAIGTGSCSVGSVVEIFAIEKYGYHFTKWSDGNTDNPRFVEVTSDCTFTAEFEVNNYSVLAEANAVAMGKVDGGAEYAYLSRTQLKAIPNDGYKFTAWSDGETENPRNILVYSDTTFTAVFMAVEATTVVESAAQVNIYAAGKTIVIENATEEIRVYDAMGRIVGRDVARNVCTITVNNSGVYIVKTGNEVKRVMIK